jgi:hypothetical protein
MADFPRTVGKMAGGGFARRPGALLATGGVFMLALVGLFVSVAIFVDPELATQTILNQAEPDPNRIFSHQYGHAPLAYAAIFIGQVVSHSKP